MDKKCVRRGSEWNFPAGEGKGTRTREDCLKLAKKYFDQWISIVQRYGWRCTVLYRDSREDMPAEASEWAAGHTVATFAYLEATININLRKLEDMDEEQIEYVVIHELVHLLVSPMAEDVNVVPHEYTVTSIARILQGLRN